MGLTVLCAPVSSRPAACALARRAAAAAPLAQAAHMRCLLCVLRRGAKEVGCPDCHGTGFKVRL